ncbi:MAG TPA: LapA family protein [Acidimicrobiales bacterium]|nr:LapA family protein [Acidimicrobiales bacterium]
MSMDWKEQDRRSAAPEGEKRRISAALVLLLLLIVIAVIFIFQNTRHATITFLFWDGDVAIWIGIVIAMILGALIDRLGSWYMRRRRRQQAQ